MATGTNTNPIAQQTGNQQQPQQFGSMTTPAGFIWGQGPNQVPAPTTGGTAQPGTLPNGSANPGMPNDPNAGNTLNPTSGTPNDYWTQWNNSFIQNGTGPINVDPNILNSMQQYQQAAYANQQSRLDPQWQLARNQFDQQMQSQGFAPGSAGYQTAYDNLMRSQNDAYSQAYNNAYSTGLSAQNQAFQQSALPEELLNQLRIASNQGASNVAAAGIQANASMQNNAMNNATNQLLGLGNLGLGYGSQQLQGNQMDFGNLMQLMGYGNGMNQYNNSLIGGAQNAMLGGIPNSNPSMVDVTGAYGLNQQGNAMNYNASMQQANAQNQMLGELGSAAMMMFMFSSKSLKKDNGPVDKADVLEALCSIPVHAWTYKDDPSNTPHIGAFAEDFNAALGLPDKIYINVVDAVGALTAAVQRLTERIERLEKANV